MLFAFVIVYLLGTIALGLWAAKRVRTTADFAVAEREQVDEIMMGVGRHPQWLRWINPSIAHGVIARTDIPVSVLARGQAGLLERYALPAGVAGLAALLLTSE